MIYFLYILSDQKLFINYFFILIRFAQNFSLIQDINMHLLNENHEKKNGNNQKRVHPQLQ